MVLTLLLLAVANLPGNVARHITQVPGMITLELVPQFEHGWPLTHLVRQGNPNFGYLGLTFEEPTITRCWQFWDIGDKDELFLFRLAGNIGIGLAITLLSGSLFEVWRRRHRSLFQVHLMDVGLATTAIAGLLGWYVAARSVHEREKTALNAHVDEMTENGMIRHTRTAADGVVKEQRGPTWIRLCLGDQHFEVLDRVIAAAPLKGRRISSLVPFRELRVTSVECRDLQELSQLGQFRQLEKLDLSLRIRTSLGEDDTIPLPPLPNLRVLTIRSLENRPAGLDQLSNLRDLDLQAAFITSTSLQEIGRLPKLRRLSLAYSSFSPEEFRHLKPLAELEDLDLDQTLVSDNAARWLTELPALKTLSLHKSRMTEASLASIARCQNLESIALDNLSEGGLRNLTSSPRLRGIYVTYPDRKAMSWPKQIYGWRIHSQMGDGAWYFTRENRTGTEQP